MEVTLAVAMRFLHLICVALVMGGLTAMLFCVRPVAAKLGGDAVDAVQERLHKLIVFAVIGLVISGVFGWVRHAGVYKEMGAYANALIGTKVLLAAIMFTVVFLRSVKLLKPSRFWLNFNLHLGVVVMILGAVLQVLRGMFLMKGH